MVTIVQRQYDTASAEALIAAGFPGPLARVLAARGIQLPYQLEASLSGLIPPERLTNNGRMAQLLADAIVQGK